MGFSNLSFNNLLPKAVDALLTIPYKEPNLLLILEE